MSKKEKRVLKIRDLTLRDGQQSQFATRMSQAQVNKVIDLYKEANFWAMEVWGGAVPDSIMRYLNEDPWERLESIHKIIQDKSYLTALSRGRNLFGYKPYPDTVIEGFYKCAAEAGLGIMRIFDALNDIDNIKSNVVFAKKYGIMADCAICYTVDPKFTPHQRNEALLTGKELPENLFNTDYFVNKALEMEKLGADMITIKDMAGIMHPKRAMDLVRGLKKALKIPVDLHTHSTPGYGLASAIVSIVNGVDVVDTVLWNWAGGPSHPAFEFVWEVCRRLGIEIDVNIDVTYKINELLTELREELKEYDTIRKLPMQFDFRKDKMPAVIDKLFDKAIEAAQKDDIEHLLIYSQQIEDYFGFPPPDEAVRDAEIPAVCTLTMVAQLKQFKQEHLLHRVLECVPLVRFDAGLIPLVTPTSQIVGVQAVMCVMDENKGLPWYTNVNAQYRDLVQGKYGKTPWPVDPAFREKICGTREEIPYNVDDYEEQPNPVLPEYGNVKLIQNERERLLMELLPQVAEKFLRSRREKEYDEYLNQQYEERLRKLQEEKERYKQLSKEEKEKILQQGLWTGW